MRSQKQLILGVVRSSPEHMTAEEIHSLARRERGSLALGTVYRNLTQLEQEGQIRRLEVPGQPLRFDRTVTPHGSLSR